MAYEDYVQWKDVFNEIQDEFAKDPAWAQTVFARRSDSQAMITELEQRVSPVPPALAARLENESVWVNLFNLAASLDLVGGITPMIN